MASEFRQVQNEDSVISYSGATFRLNTLYSLFAKVWDNYSAMAKIVEEFATQGEGKLPNDSDLFSNGIDSQLLEIGSSNWVKGKARLKIVLEFSPDALEELTELNPQCELSPLDEIRQMSVDTN